MFAVAVSVSFPTLVYNSFGVILCIESEGRVRVNSVACDCPIVPARYVLKMTLSPWTGLAHASRVSCMSLFLESVLHDLPSSPSLHYYTLSCFL